MQLKTPPVEEEFIQNPTDSIIKTFDKKYFWRSYLSFDTKNKSAIATKMSFLCFSFGAVLLI